MRRLLATAALALAGCAAAPTYNQDGINAVNRGDYAAAERYFMQGVQRGDATSINNMGALAARRGDRAAAVRYYTLAARWGNALAQSNLASMGAPVPAADLAAQRAQAEAADAANQAAAIRLLDAAIPTPAPAPGLSPAMNCSSRRSGSTVETSCF